MPNETIHIELSREETKALLYGVAFGGPGPGWLALGKRKLRAALDQPHSTERVEGDGAALIAAERRRQVEAEGWTPEHDDAHDSGEMAVAATFYLDPPLGSGWGEGAPDGWPWEPEAWKPKDQVSNLIRAGALIAAEIDRLQRAEQS